MKSNLDKIAGFFHQLINNHFGSGNYFKHERISDRTVVFASVQRR